MPNSAELCKLCVNQGECKFAQADIEEILNAPATELKLCVNYGGTRSIEAAKAFSVPDVYIQTQQGPVSLADIITGSTLSVRYWSALGKAITLRMTLPGLAASSIRINKTNESWYEQNWHLPDEIESIAQESEIDSSEVGSHDRKIFEDVYRRIDSILRYEPDRIIYPEEE